MKKNKNNITMKMARIFAVAAVFCAVFGAVYEAFSHQVYSPFMYLAFLIPLLGGALPYVLIRLSGARRPIKSSIYLHAAGIAILTVGSILRGVLEIYGTTNHLMIIYLIAGIIPILLGVGGYILTLIAAKRCA